MRCPLRAQLIQLKILILPYCTVKSDKIKLLQAITLKYGCIHSLKMKAYVQAKDLKPNGCDELWSKGMKSMKKF